VTAVREALAGGGHTSTAAPELF
ncbi:MAG: hypothetical protein QOG81_1144, partial [Gaiellaceae bacterium]|nr:hypothetical protein [Gaiellaceae bacterium]